MPPHFPDLDQLDPQALKSLILSQREQLASRDVEIEHLKLLIAKLRRQQFGRSSEKREHQIEQLELRLEELEAKRTERNGSGKRSSSGEHRGSTTCTASVAPEHLPREVPEVPSEARSLSGLWRSAETSWRRCLGNPGVRSGQSQSHSVHTSQAGLRVLRSHRAGCSAEPTDLT